MEKDRSTARRVLVHVGPYALAIVFLLSGISKILSPDGFLRFVSSIPWINFADGHVLLLMLCALEFTTGLLLMFPRTRIVGSGIALGSLFLFTLLLMIVSQSGSEGSCGCFGSMIHESSIDDAIFRNVILLFVATFSLQSSLGFKKGSLRGILPRWD